MMPLKSAVLFLVFNRPEHTERAFAAIRAARPARLYVAADGPRPGRAGEAELCRRAREAAAAVDWPCEVRTRFLDDNQGCRRAISGALAWFFEAEAEGIILEDDLVADPTFFAFADEMLERYRDDPRVFSINGSNYGYVPDWPESYRFTMFMNMSGWATWRRSFRRVDPAMSDWAKRRLRRIPHLYRLLRGPLWPDREILDWALYWRDRFDATLDGRVDSWGYVWVYNALQLGMLCVVPRVNMVRNIGWGAGATHTPDASDPRADIRAEALPLPVRHAPAVKRDPAYDRFAMETWARHRDTASERRGRLRALGMDVAPGLTEGLIAIRRRARSLLGRRTAG